MKDFFLGIAKKRLFLFLDEKIYQFKGESLVESSREQFEKTLMPVLVVSREDYKESAKDYPITDKKDLAYILANEYSVDSIKIVETTDQHSSVAKVWTPTIKVLELVENKPCIWLPESLLLSQKGKEGLSVFERRRAKLFMFKQDSRSFSSVNTGPYNSAEYFLLSIGAEQDTPVLEYGENGFVEALYAALFSGNASQYLSIFRAQKLKVYLKNLTNWPSFGIGVVAMTTLFMGAQVAYYKTKMGIIESNIEQQNVSTIFKSERQLEAQIGLLNELQSSQSGSSSSFPIWKLLAELMNQDISLIFIKNSPTGLKLRLEAKSATEALSLVRSLDWVEKADYSSSISNSRGMQRFNLDITLKKGGGSE